MPTDQPNRNEDPMTTATELTRVYQRGDDDCLRAAVATLLQIRYEETPDLAWASSKGPRHAISETVAENPTWQEWSRWARNRGLRLVLHPRYAPVWRDRWIANIDCLDGITGARTAHALVMNGKDVAHDPASPLTGRKAVSPGEIIFAVTFDPIGYRPPTRRRMHRDDIWPIGERVGAEGVELVPAGYGKARAPISFSTPAVFSAASGFDTESGAITGDSLAVGGTWTGAGDTDDFSASGGVATRTAVSDTAPGRFVVASSPTLTATAVRIDFKSSVLSSGILIGAVARFTDTSNYALAAVNVGGAAFTVYRFAGGVARETSVTVPALVVDTYYSIWFVVDASGNFWAAMGPQRSAPVASLVVGSDSALATGGTIASGKAGFMDTQSTSTAATRTFDNFACWAPEADAAIYAGRTLEFRHDDTIRQNSDGTVYGRPSVARGPGVYLPQAGGEAKVCRIVAKAARNDIEQAPRDNIADSLKLEVRATPRWLVTPR